VACCLRGGGERKATVTCGENVAVTDTPIQTRISNVNSRDLFAGKSLRAPATNQDEGLAAKTASPFVFLSENYPNSTSWTNWILKLGAGIAANDWWAGSYRRCAFTCSQPHGCEQPKTTRRNGVPGPIDFGDSERVRAQGWPAALPTQNAGVLNSQRRRWRPIGMSPRPLSGTSTGFLVLGLMLRNYLPYFTSCLTETRLVTEFVTREAPRLTRSAQVEAGVAEVVLLGLSAQSVNLGCPPSRSGLWPPRAKVCRKLPICEPGRWIRLSTPSQ